jgi:colicin import membrane protein
MKSQINENKRSKWQSLSKKIVLLSFLFIASNAFYGQTTKTKEKAAAESAAKSTADAKKTTDKAVIDSKATAEKAKTDAKKTTDHVAKDSKATVEKTTTEAKKASDHVAKDSKVTAEKAKTDAKKTTDHVAKDSKATVDKTKTEAKKEVAKTTDKVTGEYNGKKVYTGPQGGQYYINSNGNKVYIKQ